MKAFLPLLFLLLAGLGTPGQARDTAARPWEMLGDMLRKNKPPIDARRPPVPISKLESADLWDAFLTQVVKRSAGEARDGGARQEFLFVLLSGRHDGVALLAREAAVPDPLRELFLLSWDRLAPLVRDLSSEVDAQVARQFQAFLKAGEALKAAQGTVQLIVPPEGTRSKTTQWRTGFYYIALAAEVPIQLAFMDYTHKRAGLGPVFLPTGDIERDMRVIKAFYAPFRGKNAQQFDAG